MAGDRQHSEDSEVSLECLGRGGVTECFIVTHRQSQSRITSRTRFFPLRQAEVINCTSGKGISGEEAKWRQGERACDRHLKSPTFSLFFLIKFRGILSRQSARVKCHLMNRLPKHKSLLLERNSRRKKVRK